MTARKIDERRFDENKEIPMLASYLRCITKSAESPTKIAKQIHYEMEEMLDLVMKLP